MHKGNFDITIKDISKIEGHASLDVKVKKRKVKDVKLKIVENKRFYTQAVRGKPALSVHQIVSRICGTCSIAHLTACIETVEKIYGHKPSKQTLDLRNLLLYGLNIRDHAMHLYLFCLPDVLGKDSVLDFEDNGREHELLHNAFDIKAIGNELCTIVGGRSVHAPYPVPGGFTQIPKKKDLSKLISKFKKVRKYALKFVEIFYDCNFEFIEDKPEYVALMNNDFGYLGEEICSTDKYCIPERNYHEHFTRKIIPYSQATGFNFKERPFVAGAISRMNLNGKSLHPKTKKSVKEYLKVFPSDNIFHNNLAQAIEIVNCMDRSMDIIENIKLREEKVPQLKLGKKREDVGAIEAPRGTLYYHLKVDDSGKIAHANLVIPTAQNQINMEKDVGRLVQQKLDKGMGKKEIKYEIEKLIRAYDPCMSCATHFLKLNWI